MKIPLMTLFALVALLTVATSGALAEDPVLRERADAYEDWLRTWHIPEYGGMTEVVFTDTTFQEVLFYRAMGDSTMWTATYMAAECYRYAVTGEKDAKQNAIDAFNTLQDHVAVTQTPGYIGRYVGPVDQKFLFDYLGSDILRYGEGPWLGTFWLSNSSSDQHVGWFYGHAILYDLIDDEAIRQQVRSSVRAVFDRLVANNWLIRDENGWPTTAAPNISGGERMAFCVITAHILDEQYYWDLYQQEFVDFQPLARITSFSWFTKYAEYFAFNLRHQNYYNILRLDPDPDRRAFFFELFSEMIRPHVAWTHNPYFDYIWLHMCKKAGIECEDADAIAADALKSVTDFRDPPNNNVHISIPSLPIDPVSTFLVALAQLLGVEDLIDFELQTKEPHEIVNRCPEGFMWQRSPYHRFCVGFFDQEVFPGIDYLLAYWMGRYENQIDPVPEDDDDDTSDDDDDVVNDDDDSIDDDDDTSPDETSADSDSDSSGCCG
jgi:hypothetical protein